MSTSGLSTITAAAPMSFGAVTALPKEAAAMRAMLDDVEDYVSPAGRVYAIGTAPAKSGGQHRIAVVLGDQGTNAASYWATVLTEDFPEVHAVLMVGIAGAVPHPEKPDRHVRLGDIVVSGEGGVVQYDFVKDHGTLLEPRFPPRPPDATLLQAAQRLRVHELTGETPWVAFTERATRLHDVARPPVDEDRLAHSSKADQWVEHPPERRCAGQPGVFIGTIACANRLLKNPILRDDLRDRYGVMAVEMESSGVAEVTWHKSMGYLIVRGTCDYCDGKKGDAWQGHAAVLAAAYTRALLGEVPALPPRQVTRQVRLAALSDETLRGLANELLSAGAPPSLLHLFPDAPPQAREQLVALERTSRSVSSLHAKDTRKRFVEDLFAERGRHIVLGAPGSGKTFALWHASRERLKIGSTFPLYLPMATFDKWSDAAATITSAFGGNNLSVLLRDGRVRIILDGWTEFAARHPNEIAPCMRALASADVIANGRTGGAVPPGFSAWDLGPFSPITVRAALSRVFPDQPVPRGAVADLLRLPLALAIHLLLGGDDVVPGQLLATMHKHLSREMPAAFDEALCGAVAAVHLASGSRSTTHFLAELRERGRGAGVSAPERTLETIGTLDTRRSSVVPLHDLYWSWLAGRGILRDGRIPEALSDLSTREGIELAIQSGETTPAMSVPHMISSDVVLAERLTRGATRDPDVRRKVHERLMEMMCDQELAVKARGAVAAIASDSAELIRAALKTLTHLSDTGNYVAPLVNSISPDRLFPHRAIVEDWYGANGSGFVADAIAERGGPEWSPWIQQLANDRRITTPRAVAVLLACEGRLSAWTDRNLAALLESREAYRLRAAAQRGMNVELARRLCEIFEKYLDEGGSQFLHFRDVFVGCGDDAVFARLLERFPDLPTKAQTLLGYTITARGEPWLGRFQVVALEKCPSTDHHELFSELSPNIDEQTARAWLRAGHEHLGWRALAQRNVPGIVRELVGALPETFDDLDDVASLYAMAHLKHPPEDLVDEIWARLSGTIHPRLMEQVLRALAAVRPRGVASMAGHLSRQPTFLPTYHLMRYLAHLEAWERETALHLNVSIGGRTMRFSDWLLAQRLQAEPEDHFLRSALSSYSARMMPILLEWFEAGDNSAFDLIKVAGSIPSFHEGVVARLVSTGAETLIPKLFGDCLDSFPEDALMRLVASSGGGLGELVRAIAQRPSPTHARVHVALAKRVLEASTDHSSLRWLAKIFTVHGKETLRPLLEPVCMSTPKGIWLLREVESATNFLLVNEDGTWRDQGGRCQP